MAKTNGTGRRKRHDSLARRIRSAPLTRELAARLGSFYLRIVWITTRWRFEGREHLDALLDQPSGFIVCVWHGRLFISPCLKPPSRQIFAMISDNRDGEIITRLVGFHDVQAVRGSTADPRKRDKAKGGGEAFRESLPLLRAGHMVAITPDGPRGPRMRAQNGVSAISATANVPVLPYGISTSRGKLLRNWDRFLIPYPFGRGAIVCSPAIFPPASGDAEAAEAHRLAIENATTDATRRADEICGRETPEPADEIRT